MGLSNIPYYNMGGNQTKEQQLNVLSGGLPLSQTELMSKYNFTKAEDISSNTASVGLGTMKGGRGNQGGQLMGPSIVNSYYNNEYLPGPGLISDQDSIYSKLLSTFDSRN